MGLMGTLDFAASFADMDERIGEIDGGAGLPNKSVGWLAGLPNSDVGWLAGFEVLGSVEGRKVRVTHMFKFVINYLS